MRARGQLSPSRRVASNNIVSCRIVSCHSMSCHSMSRHEIQQFQIIKHKFKEWARTAECLSPIVLSSFSLAVVVVVVVVLLLLLRPRAGGLRAPALLQALRRNAASRLGRVMIVTTTTIGSTTTTTTVTVTVTIITGWATGLLRKGFVGFGILTNMFKNNCCIS